MVSAKENQTHTLPPLGSADSQLVRFSGYLNEEVILY